MKEQSEGQGRKNGDRKESQIPQSPSTVLQTQQVLKAMCFELNQTAQVSSNSIFPTPA